jgi:hypothetical protein
MAARAPGQAAWRRRLWRGWWPGRNPQRRASDRIEAVIVGLLVAGFLAGAPVLGVAAGH